MEQIVPVPLWHNTAVKKKRFGYTREMAAYFELCGECIDCGTKVDPKQESLATRSFLNIYVKTLIDEIESIL
jgi:hypothetical protein